MKLLVDMNLSPSWVEFLSQSGFTAIHWSCIGPSNAADEDIMDYAADSGMVIFTNDLDFGALLARRGDTCPSVIQIRGQEVLPGVIGDAIVRAITATSEQIASGALVTIDASRSRIRLLPLR